jgi:hypothetical protein
MNKSIVFAALVVFSCGFQGKSTVFFDKQFKWKIAVPADFVPMSDEQVQKHTETGSTAISKATGTEFESQGEIICIFQKNGMNTFTASYRSYDSTTDGSISEICQNTMKIIRETYQAQFKGTKADTSSLIETIDGLVFTVVKIIACLPNQKTVTMLFYERIIDDKLFSFNINYVDGKIGAEIIRAWKKSKFIRG